MILLDTNVISEVQRPQGNGRVRSLVAARAAEMHLSVIVLGELRFGIALLDDTPRKAALAAWADGLIAAYADRILPVTREIAEIWGGLSAVPHMKKRPVDAPDGLIAATAIFHDLTLWTRNTKDFEGVGVRLVNPWED